MRSWHRLEGVHGGPAETLGAMGDFYLAMTPGPANWRGFVDEEYDLRARIFRQGESIAEEVPLPAGAVWTNYIFGDKIFALLEQPEPGEEGCPAPRWEPDPRTPARDERIARTSRLARAPSAATARGRHGDGARTCIRAQRAPTTRMPQPPPLSIRVSPYFMAWLADADLSLAFTTYQTHRLFLVGRKADGQLSAFERLFDRPMGLFATSESLYLSTRAQMWRFENALPAGVEHEGFDRLYVPRVAHTTGDLDAHDVAVDSAGSVVFASTAYSCLATLSERYSFQPLWQPSFISRLAPEDRCHLNGLAMADGAPAFVTTVSRSDVAGGWRERRGSGGCVIDVRSDEIVCDTLSMPHSPRWYRDQLWVLNAGSGEFGYVDGIGRAAGRAHFVPVAFCPGFLRGLAFHGDYAIVGLSKQRREKIFAGLPLDDQLRAKDTDARCGLWVIDLRSGVVAHWLELEGVVTELYDVQTLPGVRRPTALGWKSDEIQRTITIDSAAGPVFQPLARSPDATSR